MVKLLDTSRLPKPEDLQCDNLNYALTKKYQDTVSKCVSLALVIVLMMVVQLVLVEGTLNLCMCQEWTSS